MHAAGVNRADLLRRQGYYGRQSYGDGTLLGPDVAGEIVAVGNAVTDVRPGERVMAVVGGGGYAAFAHVDRGMAVRIPDTLDAIGAAAGVDAFVTAWEAVVHLGGAASGGAELLHVAAGGVDSAGVEIAHALRTRVFATANLRGAPMFSPSPRRPCSTIAPKISRRACMRPPAGAKSM